MGGFGEDVAGVGAVRPDQPEPTEAFPQRGQHPAGGVAVRHRRGGDQHRQDEAEAVHDQVPLASVDQLAAVEAAGGRADHGVPFHRLRVHYPRGRLRVPALRLADAFWLVIDGTLPVAGAAVRIDPDGTCHLSHGGWSATVGGQ